MNRTNLFHAVVLVGCSMVGCSTSSSVAPSRTLTQDMAVPQSEPDLSPPRDASPSPDLTDLAPLPDLTDLGPDLRDHQDGFHTTK